MRKTFVILFLLQPIVFFTACERPDYTDEIKEAYRLGNHGQVIDGNMWSARSEDWMTFKEAGNYCYHLTELGYNDWRLPTIDELRTLIKDCSKTETSGSCGLTDECITDEEDSVYNCFEPQSCNCKYRYPSQDESSYSKLGDWESLWSSIENDCKNDEDAWYVNFSDGGVHQPTASGSVACQHYSSPTMYVRCVR